MKTILWLLLLIFFIYSALCEEQNNVENDMADQRNSSQPKYWRAILGDICQLPSFPHATADPTRYLECINENSTIIDRNDMGIWLLRECPPEHIFVAPALRCMTIQAVIQWLRYCDGSGANDSAYCLNSNEQSPHYVIQETRPSLGQCACALGENNCTCQRLEIFEPVPVNSSAYIRARRDVASLSTVGMSSLTECPSSSANCLYPGQTQQVRSQQIRSQPIVPQSVAQQPPLASAQPAQQTSAQQHILPQQIPTQQQMASTQQVSMQQTVGGPQIAQPIQPQSSVQQSQIAPQQYAQQPQQIPFRSTNVVQGVPQQPSIIQQQPQWNGVNVAPPMTLPNAQTQQTSPLTLKQQQAITPTVGCLCPETGCICNDAQPSSRVTITQQQYYPQSGEPSSLVQPRECPLVQGQTSQNAQYQGICSWMIEPLAVDPEGITTYLQCQPTTNSLYCGRWQRMPCPPGTTFNVNMQLCVWDAGVQSGSGVSQPPYVTPPTSFVNGVKCTCIIGIVISVCGPNNLCPGQSICQSPCSICCYAPGRFQ